MHSFLSRISKNDFFVAWFAQKTKMIKSSIFSQKPWSNPFKKFRFSGLFQNSIFWPKKPSILFRISKNDVFWIDLPKKHTWSKVRFFEKKMDPIPPPPPFAKSGFFVLFENLIFLVYKEFYFYAEDKKRSFWLDLPKKHT